MMKIELNKNILSALILLWSISGLAQSEALTSSPYSFYGLGVINQTNIGRSNGMGYSGIGLKTNTEINNLNPANFALIPKNSFFYDMGITYEHNTYSNSGYNENKNNLNFSNLAMAFRITEGLGVGFVMTPYSDVGYSLIGLQTNIEGSNEYFESNVTGLGGLNDLKFNLGYSATEKLRLGLSASMLFGSIEENEIATLTYTQIDIDETTNYSGLRMGFGLHYDISDNITFGSTVQLPVTLGANSTTSISKYLDGVQISVEEDDDDSSTGFKLPLELGFGVSGKFFDKLTLTADYKKNFWDNTNQTENLGVYSDQDIYAFGMEYVKDPKSYKYGQRIRYRLGFNYDNGYLALNDKKIDGYNITTGIGIPINNSSNSILNLSYSYGSKGQIQNILVKENYHLLTLNFSFEDLWFRKREIY